VRHVEECVDPLFDLAYEGIAEVDIARSVAIR